MAVRTRYYVIFLPAVEG